MKSSDAKASKCHLKFSSLMMIFYQTCMFKFSNFTYITINRQLSLPFKWNHWITKWSTELEVL